MKKENIFILIAIVAFLGVIVLIVKYHQEQKVVGNQDILKELNKLLLPVYYQNISEKDFNGLRYMVRKDNIASDEVDELILLSKYGESTHIGHGIAYLYDYIQTGKFQTCPGHELAHFYVFLKHGETQAANENLEKAKSDIGQYKTYVESLNKSSNEIGDYKASSDLIDLTLQKIGSGDNSSSNEQISFLSNAPCTK